MKYKDLQKFNPPATENNKAAWRHPGLLDWNLLLEDFAFSDFATQDSLKPVRIVVLLPGDFINPKAMKITEALFAEHQVFHSLFDYVERSAPRLKTLAEIKAVASVLEAALKAHSSTEDELLLAPMDHCIAQLGHADTFHQEHEEIDESLRQIQSARRPGTARKLLLAAVQASRIHFDKEERIVFPMADKTLSATTLQNLGRAWERRRELAAV